MKLIRYITSKTHDKFQNREINLMQLMMDSTRDSCAHADETVYKITIEIKENK
jgi:hypothetical protein